jgi:hypothetical protein
MDEQDMKILKLLPVEMFALSTRGFCDDCVHLIAHQNCFISHYRLFDFSLVPRFFVESFPDAGLL